VPWYYAAAKEKFLKFKAPFSFFFRLLYRSKSPYSLDANFDEISSINQEIESQSFKIDESSLWN
jgi:hypothetical protein